VSRRALLLAVLAAPACLSATQRREDNLIREARTFNDDVRWSRWEAASAAMPKDDGAAFLARVSAVEGDLMLGDYEVTSINFAAGSEAATVVAHFEWYTRRDPTVRSTTLEQRWEYREGRWTMVKVRRTRGDRLGLVTEPVPPPAP
jgi:hypothetical protein